MLIRTLEAHQDKKGWLGQIYAGGGITIESDPAAEVEEAKLKAAALLEACGWQEKSDKKPISKPLEINTISLNEAPLRSIKQVRYITRYKRITMSFLLIILTHFHITSFI